MREEKRAAVVIGGGPAGLAAAIQLHKLGVKDLVVLEREKQAGGILRQCIHDGFGLARFGQNLCGPEYAQRFLDEANALGIKICTNTSVIGLTPGRCVTSAGPDGLCRWQAGAVVLAMGCRERTRGALAIPGERPAGVFTAGVAQSYINLYNRMIGRRVVILGSGDIGLIMARRLTLEGARVLGVYELQPWPSGLARNLHQCLDDYGIPLHLAHTVTEIHGRARLTGVTVSEVDAGGRPVPGTEERVDCDTLILSVGLLPETELAREAGIALDERTRGPAVDQYLQTSLPGVFAGGNVLHVHDLVDEVSREAERLAAGAARFLAEGGLPACRVRTRAGEGVGQLLPCALQGGEEACLSLRVTRPMRNARLEVRQNGRLLRQLKLPRAAPAEMLQVPLAAGTIDKEGTVEVSAAGPFAE